MTDDTHPNPDDAPFSMDGPKYEAHELPNNFGLEHLPPKNITIRQPVPPPIWRDGEPANLQAAALDAIEWLQGLRNSEREYLTWRRLERTITALERFALLEEPTDG